MASFGLGPTASLVRKAPELGFGFGFFSPSFDLQGRDTSPFWAFSHLLALPTLGVFDLLPLNSISISPAGRLYHIAHNNPKTSS